MSPTLAWRVPAADLSPACLTVPLLTVRHFEREETGLEGKEGKLSCSCHRLVFRHKSGWHGNEGVSMVTNYSSGLVKNDRNILCVKFCWAGRQHGLRAVVLISWGNFLLGADGCGLVWVCFSFPGPDGASRGLVVSAEVW